MLGIVVLAILAPSLSPPPETFLAKAAPQIESKVSGYSSNLQGFSVKEDKGHRNPYREGFLSVLEPTPGVNDVVPDAGHPGDALAGGVGKTMTVTVDFSSVVPGATLIVQSGDTHMLVDGQASSVYIVQSGDVSHDFAVTAPSDVVADVPVTLIAVISDGSTFSVGYLYATVKPFVQTMVLSRGSVNSGGSINGWVKVWELPATDQILNLTFTSPYIASSPATTVMVHANATLPYSDTFMGAAVYVDANQSLTATAALQGGASSNSAVFPIYGPALSSFAFSPSTIAGGATPSVTVTLTNPGASAQTILLSSSNTAASGNITAVVPAQSTTVTVNGAAVETLYGTKNATVTYTGSLGGNTRTGPLTILAQPAISSVSADASVVEGQSFDVTVNLSAKPWLGCRLHSRAANRRVVPTFTGTFNGGESSHTFSVPSTLTKLGSPVSVALSAQL